MTNSLFKNKPTRAKLMIMAGAGWTFVISLSFFWSWQYIGNTMMFLAVSDARSSFQKDLVYRRWVTLQGGVYVTPTEMTPPNPYLAHLPDRDVTTTDGKSLTLVNPAYMTRQVHELGREQYGLQGHITSLDPIRPENAPDAWETESLQAFAAGATETSSVEEIDGQPFLRLMRPFVTEAGCIRCHGVQGYKEGDIRGGISVSAPLTTYNAVIVKQRTLIVLVHMLIWPLGLLGLWAGNRLMRKQMRLMEMQKDESSRMLVDLNMHQAELQIQKEETSRMFHELSVHHTEIEMQNEELRRAQEELEDSRSRYFDLYDLAPVGYVTVSEKGFILEANLTAAVLLGVARGAMVKQPILSFIDKEDQGIYYFHSKTLYKPGGWNAFELRMVRTDGPPFWAGIDATAVLGKNGDPVCRIVLRDLTDRKAAESERIARRAAEEASAAKSMFLANMSHEIRTPMNAVMGFAHVLGNDPSLSPKQAEHVRVILRSGEHLLRLINDILDMSRIDAGKAKLNLEDFRLFDLIKEMETLFQDGVAAKGLGFVLAGCDHLPDVHADLGKLRQILINLLGNAIKFTQTGQIVLRVHCNAISGPADAQMASLVVEVEDTGPGISDNNPDRVFDLFFQSSDGVRAGGTGLGLSISRKNAQMMGGNLTVTSRMGTGACFRLEVPVQKVRGPIREGRISRRGIVLEPGAGPWRILVVDDMPENLALHTAMLQPVGFEIREACNGAEALEIFEDWLPHAVLLDLLMPVMNGYEVARRIKAHDAGRNVLVVAVTAAAFQDSRKEAMAAGVDAFLSIPFHAHELFEILSKGLGLSYVFVKDQGQTVAVHRTSHANVPVTLPRTTVCAIRKAVADGDVVLLTQLIETTESEDPQAARTLRNMAENFDYSGIAAWLDQVDNNGSNIAGSTAHPAEQGDVK